MTQDQIALWLRLTFVFPFDMNPWFRFWLNAMTAPEDIRKGVRLQTRRKQ